MHFLQDYYLRSYAAPLVKQFIVQRVPPSFSYCSLIAVYLRERLQPSSVHKPNGIMPFNLGIKAELCLLLQQVSFFHGQAHFIGSIFLGRIPNLSQIRPVQHSNTHSPLGNWIINIIQEGKLKAAAVAIKKEERVGFGAIKVELFIKILQNIGKNI